MREAKGRRAFVSMGNLIRRKISTAAIILFCILMISSSPSFKSLCCECYV